jgi:hypothetical protein
MSETQDSVETGVAGADSIEVSDSWKRRFELLEKAGAGDGLKAYLRRYKALSYGERLKTGFNFWGLVFGPIYYFCKKMWQKGAFLLGAMWTLSAALTLVEIAIGKTLPAVIYYIPMAAVCASLANYDYYRLRVKQECLWGGLPKIFSGKPGAIGFPCLAFLALVIVTAIKMEPMNPEYGVPETDSFEMQQQYPQRMPQQYPQQMPQQQYPQQMPQQQYPQQTPQQQMSQQQMPQQQMQPGPLEGMWMMNNGASAMFQGNFYVIAANNQAIEGGSYMIQGSEMVMQVMQGQGAGQQRRYNFQPGPDGQSFTLTMQNGSGSIIYQRMGSLPPTPQQQGYPQQMPQQGYPQQGYPQQTPQQYPQMPR